MTKPNCKSESWVIWLTGMFALAAFCVFAFAIFRHRRVQHNESPSLTTHNIASSNVQITDECTGKFNVVRVHDGDSLTLVGTDGLEISVRLRGIDAPELGQPYGYEAKLALQTLLKAGTVGLSDPKKEKYGRYSADMYLGDIWVNQVMVVEGHAWCDQINSFNRTLYSVEQQAKAQGRGLWAFPTQRPPWIWRVEQK